MIANRFQIRQRQWNLNGEMRDYVLQGNGLSFYGLAEIKDPLQRGSVAGHLLKDHSFLFPNPEVAFFRIISDD
jgi:hypothetical protein